MIRQPTRSDHTYLSSLFCLLSLLSTHPSFLFIVIKKLASSIKKSVYAIIEFLSLWLRYLVLRETPAAATPLLLTH